MSHEEGCILIVDDERLTRETLRTQLEDARFTVWAAANPFQALEILQKHEMDVVVTDLRMPSMGGLDFQRRVREHWPDTAIVFITAFATVSTAVEAMRAGAADYLGKPLDGEELVIRLGRLVQRRKEVDEVRRLRLETARQRQVGQLIYRSEAMAQVVERAVTVADTDVSLLIEGETGTGKEVLARVIHQHSLRQQGPFVVVNCAGLNPNLIESELFGHEPGAFTGAVHARKGRVEMASRGTLLIDEVDDLSPEIQVRLLRLLHDRAFERVGGSRTLTADVRVISATKRALPDLVQTGVFRDDLYYRLNTVQITLPPLRCRREDIVPLAEHFVVQFHKDRGTGPSPELTSETLAVLLAHRWPGNVRELQHAMEHAVAFARGAQIEPRHLPSTIMVDSGVPLVELHLEHRESVSFVTAMVNCERQLLEWALTQAGGNQVRAAEMLQLARTTFRSRLAALQDVSSEDDTPNDA